MKILVVCMHYYPEPFTITSICEHFARQGHDVLVVTSKPHYGYAKIPEEYEHVDDEVINGVRVHRCDIAIRTESTLSIVKNYLSFYFNAKKYIKRLKENFDVVYSMSLSPIISVSPANIYAKKHHVKHVLHCLDLWPESVLITNAMGKHNPLYHLLYHWSRSIYKKADEILVSSPSFIDYFSDVLKLPTKNIWFVMQPPLLANQIGEDKQYKVPTLVYAGNIGKLQMVDEIVKAMKIVKDDSYNVNLIIIGNGSEASEVKGLIQEFHLEDRSEFLGMKPRGETAAYYANATGIIIPLKQGGYVGKTIPNKLVSSLNEGRPILAFLHGDGARLLDQAGGSIFAKGEDARAFAEAIEELLSLSKEEREKLGTNNRAFYESKCQKDEICQEILNELIEATKL